MGNRRRHPRGLAVITGLLLLLYGACGPPQEGGQTLASGNVLEVDLDKSNPERLLRYYFSGYVAPGGGDPLEAGLLHARGGRYYVDLDAMEGRHPGHAAGLRAVAGDGTLDWKELARFLNATYYAARSLPPTLEALRAEVPYRAGTEPWFEVELDGVMTTARRHVFVAESALRHALRRYHDNDRGLIYPDGTTLVGEHRRDGRLIETTVMRKRSDGFWDFFTYGSDGTLAPATQALPRALKSPTQCVGCHFGSKPFEPERSFPGAAPPGPHGPRALYVADELRDDEVVAFFDEHRKRSDRVLGLYNTLFVARLRADRRDGRLSEDDRGLLENLGL